MKKIGIAKTPTQNLNYEDNLTDIVSNMATSKYSSYNNIKQIENNLTIRDEDIIRRLNVHQIYPNPLNKKYMKGITEEKINILKESILSQGLMHNLVVIEDGNGRYKLISGEKRWTAISKMTDQEYRKAFPNDILCKVYTRTEETKDVDELLILLIANVITFSNGSPDLDQVRDLIKVYTELGYEKKQIIEYFQEQLKKSTSTIKDMVSGASANEELFEMYNSGLLSKKSLAMLGALDSEEQTKIATIIKERSGVTKISDEEVQKLKKEIKSERKVSTTTQYRRAKEAKADTTEEYNKLFDKLANIEKLLAKIEKTDTDALKTAERESLMATSKTISRSVDFLIKKLADNSSNNANKENGTEK